MFARIVVYTILFAGFGVAVPYIVLCVMTTRHFEIEEKAVPRPEVPAWFAAVTVNDLDAKRLEWVNGKIVLLEVRSGQVGDRWVANLEDHDSLTILRLSKNSITSAGLSHLKNLVRLRELDLSRNLITDQGLQHLAGMKRLQSLDLRNTRVTLSGLQKFQKSHPDCLVRWYPAAESQSP
jgi:hypothetical protein